MSLSEVLTDILDKQTYQEVTVAAEGEVVTPVKDLSHLDDYADKLETLGRNKKALAALLTPQSATKAIATEVFTMLGSFDGKSLLNKLTESATGNNTAILTSPVNSLISEVTDQEKSISYDLFMAQHEASQEAEKNHDQSCVIVKLIQKLLFKEVLVVVDGATVKLVDVSLDKLAYTDDTLYCYAPFSGKLEKAARDLTEDEYFSKQFTRTTALRDVLNLVLQQCLTLDQVKGKQLDSVTNVRTRIEMIKSVKQLSYLLEQNKSNSLFKLMTLVEIASS